MTSDFGRAVKTNLEATHRLKGTLDSQKSKIEALEQQGQQQGAAGQNPAGGTYVVGCFPLTLLELSDFW